MASSPLAAQAQLARKTFELENDIHLADKIYAFDNAEQQRCIAQRPWEQDPKYFKHVKISALALVKMVMHARSGGTIEVMGLMQGKIDVNDARGPTIIVMDSFTLPVEGTETRVNAQADAYEYMVEYQSLSRQGGRLDNVIGWYHSHPGYGCWLSGIDCSTQMLNQQYQEPWLAIVIDPTRTAATGKVEIGAFRTYPSGYKPTVSMENEFESVPLGKIEDFGAHQDQYYQLEISYFKSSLDTELLDTLWNKYWIATLAASPLLSNAEFITERLCDLSDKVEQADKQILHFGRGTGSSLGTGSSFFAVSERASKEDAHLKKLVKDSSKLACEHLHAQMQNLVKDVVFNHAQVAEMDTT